MSDDKIEKLLSLLIETHPDDSRVYTVNAEYLIRKQRLDEARDQTDKGPENE